MKIWKPLTQYTRYLFFYHAIAGLYTYIVFDSAVLLKVYYSFETPCALFLIFVIERIANDVLSLSRIRLQVLSIHPIEFDLVPEIRRVVAIFHNELKM